MLEATEVTGLGGLQAASGRIHCASPEWMAIQSGPATATASSSSSRPTRAIHGVGEGGIIGRELAMQGMLDHFRQFLVGMDPRRIEHIWQTMYRGAYFEGGRIMAPPPRPSTWRSGTSSASRSACRSTSCSAARLPRVGPLLRHRRPARTGRTASSGRGTLAEQGWRYIRFLPGMPVSATDGADWLTQVQRAGRASTSRWSRSSRRRTGWREIRRAVGPRVELSIDMHHRYSVGEAALFCQRVARRSV